ncbi:MAG: hypothetical protein Q8Q12_04425 [bacterium]|nr:hypothetical protein [bacterium]
MIECDDVLVHVREEAKITARLTHRKILGCVRACPRMRVRFSLDGEEIGEAEAGYDGTATVVYTPREEKEYRITASCRLKRRGKTAMAQATLFSRSTRKPGIILDIDRTLFASSTFAAIFRRSRSVSPLADAVEVTQELSQKYDLLIVTGRKRYLKEKTRRWLRMKGFPLAPVFFAPGFRPFLSHERFKFELIRQLKASWPNITIGIGDRDSDARAYLANGLRAIIIREKGPCPRGAVMARDWRAIRGLLLE